MNQRTRDKLAPRKEERPTRPMDHIRQFEDWLLGPDGEQRRNAVGFFEAAACPERKNVFIRALCYGDQEIKEWALGMLDKVSHEITDDDLLKIGDFLNIKRPDVRVCGVKALGIAAPEAFVREVLLTHLEIEKNEDVIDAAIGVLWSAEEKREKNRSFRELLMLLSEDNSAFRESTLRQIAKHRKILTGSDLRVIEAALHTESTGKQVSALEALRIINKPLETIPAVVSFLESVEKKDAEALRLAVRLLGSFRDAKEVDEDPIDSFLHLLSLNPMIKEYGIAKMISNIVDDTLVEVPLDTLPEDALRKRRTVPGLLDAYEVAEKPGREKPEKRES